MTVPSRCCDPTGDVAYQRAHRHTPGRHISSAKWCAARYQPQCEQAPRWCRTTMSRPSPAHEA
eukprot:5186799-Prymnesium_polylepis.5